MILTNIEKKHLQNGVKNSECECAAIENSIGKKKKWVGFEVKCIYCNVLDSIRKIFTLWWID